jgi:predicted transcriptional regulator
VAENETASKKVRIFSTTKTTPLDPQASNVEVLDMVDVDDDRKYEDFKSKQQAELLKQQNQEKADKPVKLSEFQCIICLDNPTDLTVTHCGLFYMPQIKYTKANHI